MDFQKKPKYLTFTFLQAMFIAQQPYWIIKCQYIAADSMFFSPALQDTKVQNKSLIYYTLKEVFSAVLARAIRFWWAVLMSSATFFFP